MISVGTLAIGGFIALLFVVWVWRILGLVAGVKTLAVGAVVVVPVALLYGLLPPLFGFMSIGAGVVVAGVISFVLLRLLF